MLMAIFLVYSTSGVTFGKKKLVASSKWRPFWKFWNIKHSFNLTSDMKRSSQIIPIKFSYGDDVIDDVTGCPQSFSLYSCLGEVGPGSKLQGQCLVNKCQYHNCLSRLYMPKKRSQWITLFEIASQRSASQAYWVTLALISNIANCLKYNYFWDCDGIDDVTLRLWKFSDFCSRHIVSVAGDDIMFHILVICVYAYILGLRAFY